MARLFASGNTIALPTGFTVPTDWTFSAWASCDLSQAYAPIIGIGVGANVGKIYIKSNGKTAFYAGGSVWDGTGSATIAANTFVNVTVTVSVGSGTATGYVNGVSDASGAGAASIGANASGGGYGSDFGVHFYVGSIAHGAMWNVVLTLPEIISLAYGAFVSSIRPQSLMFWHPLDGYIHPVFDKSGRGVFGTLSGTTLTAGPPLLSSAPILSPLPSPQNVMAAMAVILPPPPQFVLMPQIVM
jgi:hypothetical protein